MSAGARKATRPPGKPSGYAAGRTVRLFTVRLYGDGQGTDLALRVDALAFRLFRERGGAGPLRYQDAFRHLIQEGTKHESVTKHRCKVCERTYGAPWCWEHGDTTEPQGDTTEPING